MAYRSLENPMIKEKKVADTVFQIFGTAIKRYNHALTFPVRILQILRTCEVAVSPSAHGVYLLAEEFGITTIFSTLLKDLVDTLSVDAADSSTSKYFSQFLSELGTIAPKLLIPHLATLRDELLNLDVSTDSLLADTFVNNFFISSLTCYVIVYYKLWVTLLRLS